MSRETHCKACGGWHDPMARCLPAADNSQAKEDFTNLLNTAATTRVKFDRTAYQREYMRKRRAQQQKR